MQREQDDRVEAFQSDGDWTLIRRVGNGEQAALERLYKQYYSTLYRFILQITRRVDCVEEVINDVMFVVWEKAVRMLLLHQVCGLTLIRNSTLNGIRIWELIRFRLLSSRAMVTPGTKMALSRNSRD